MVRDWVSGCGCRRKTYEVFSKTYEVFTGIVTETQFSLRSQVAFETKAISDLATSKALPKKDGYEGSGKLLWWALKKRVSLASRRRKRSYERCVSTISVPERVGL